MPSICCCVPHCHLRGGHEFHTDKDRREKWILAIKRLDEGTMQNWTPSASAVVCKAHFRPEDYVQQTKDGRTPCQQKLLPSAVPTQFKWTQLKSPSEISRGQRFSVREDRKRKREEDICRNLEADVLQPLDIIEETVELCDPDILYSAVPLSTSRDCASQTDKKPMFDIDNFIDDNDGILFYTGLENYLKFMFVLNTLGPAA